MKKILALLLAIVLCFSLCACGDDAKLDNTESIPIETVIGFDDVEGVFSINGGIEKEEEWKTNTKGWTIALLEYSKMGNIVKFNEEYIGNTYVVEGIIFNIEEDGIVLGYQQKYGNPQIGANGGIKVGLSKEDLMNCKRGATVKIVGKFIESSAYAVEIKNASFA